ncbi:MAG: TRAP transporter substrate-binding protein [Dehalococcoidales bacterium]|nr:TRAP transporter substrate-binding protein [Dehalococcoidales bacterium]
MKKLVVAVLVISLLSAVCLFSACSSEEEPTQSQAPPTQPQAPVQTQAPTKAPPPAQSGPVELKFAYFPPPAAEISRLGFEAWGKAVEDATGGMVKISYFGGASLGGAPEHYDLVLSGTADIAVISPEFTPGQFPMSGIANLPGLFPNSEVAAGALWEYSKKYTMDTELKEVKLLAVSPTAPSQLLTRTKQVKTLEDLKGLKIAGTSPAHAKTVEALGGVPVLQTEGEVYTSLERGLVDGRLHAWDSTVVWKGMEVTKYRTANVNGPLNLMLILMNMDSWNKLSPEMQNIMTGLSGLGMSRYTGIIYDRANMRMLEVVKEYDKANGNPDIYWLPEDEQAKWQKAMSTYVDEWVSEMNGKGLPGEQALSDLRGWVEQYKKIYQ